MTCSILRKSERMFPGRYEDTFGPTFQRPFNWCKQVLVAQSCGYRQKLEKIPLYMLQYLPLVKKVHIAGLPESSDFRMKKLLIILHESCSTYFYYYSACRIPNLELDKEGFQFHVWTFDFNSKTIFWRNAFCEISILIRGF